MLGLKRGTISFIQRNAEWDRIAHREIKRIKTLFGSVAKDVQQIGSGAICNPSFRVKFTPILDIAVAVSSFEDVIDMESKLKANHIYHVYHKDQDDQLFFVCRHMNKGVCTAHIYVVLENSKKWECFLQFKDYLSINTERLKKYNTLKQDLVERYSTDRHAYHQGKVRFIQNIMVEAADYFTLGRKLTVVLDEVQPLHELYLRGYDKEHFEKMQKKQIVYIFGAKQGQAEFKGMITAIIAYENGDEMKLVATPCGVVIYEPQIAHDLAKEEGDKQPIYKCLYEKSCGAVVYNEDKQERTYLLIRNRSQNVGFPKGHIEYGETELQTVQREILEETGLRVEIHENFRRLYDYKVKFSVNKRAVYYLAKYTGQHIFPQEDEVLEYWIVPYTRARDLLTFDADRQILEEVEAYLQGNTLAECCEICT